MDNIQNCDSYINIPSSETDRSYLQNVFLYVYTECFGKVICSVFIQLIDSDLTELSIRRVICSIFNAFA
jgi:hypothetical protein